MMSAVAPKITSAAPVETAQHIADFLRDFSIEATRPTADDLDELKSAAPEVGRIYLSAVPTRPLSDLVAFSTAVRAAGFEPIPHLAVRNIESSDALDDLLARLTDQGGSGVCWSSPAIAIGRKGRSRAPSR
jgi:methylenetetrahydrofolate reductase (NADPH)